MKSVIVALNSKYIHSSLAAWYLKASCESGCGEVKVLEFTINDHPDQVLEAVYREKADVAAFSCYIWNIAYVLKVVENLKKVAPETVILLGGPEVSFDAEELIRSSRSIDYIITGEGEISFKLFLKRFSAFKGKGNDRLRRQQTQIEPERPGFEDIEGLVYREKDKIISNASYVLIKDLDSISSPYTDEMLASLGNRIVYYESSRGCPYSCSYCLSSTFKGVRLFSIERVKKDLELLINCHVKQVKFVDRTFNCNKARAKEIFSFIIASCKGREVSGSSSFTNFHFEAAADLFDDEMLHILSRAPEGLIQLEIGIQTTNVPALEAINRKTDLQKVFNNIHEIKTMGNIHLHLDLIAGLPFENYDSFKSSFNEVYSLKPHQLQLGFLKMLKGSKVREEAGDHGYCYREYPPYEVLFNKYISFDELLELKGIEELVERYYNSGRFVRSLEYVIGQFYPTAFEFYREFHTFNRQRGYLKYPVSSREQYSILIEFLKRNTACEVFCIAVDMLKLDFLSTDNSGNLPGGMQSQAGGDFKDRCFAFLKDESNVALYLPQYQGVPAKQIFKQVHFEVFDYGVHQEGENSEIAMKRTVILFDYGSRSRVTGRYKYHAVNL